MREGSGATRFGIDLEFQMFSNLPSLEWGGDGSLTPVIHGEGAGGGLAGFVDTFLETVTRGLDSGSSWNPLIGIEVLGWNFHPLLVHFPIAFLVSFLLAEICGLAFRRSWLRKLAGSMLYLGAAGAVAAAAAGLIADETVPHGAAVHEIMEWHKRAGLTVAGLSVILAAWRAVSGGRFSVMAQALHLMLGLVAVLCLFFGADLGGRMVYEYGVGVKSLQQPDGHHEHHHD